MSKTLQANAVDDSDDEDSRPSVLDDLPERINISAKKLRSQPTASSIPIPSGTSDFADLGISPTLTRALKTMSIQKPTPVQAACIPPLLAGELKSSSDEFPIESIKFIGQDCIGNAKTGSGKTIAFAIPILQELASDPYGIFALVLTPTRYHHDVSIQPGLVRS